MMARHDDLEEIILEQVGAPGYVECNVANGWLKGLITSGGCAQVYSVVNGFYTQRVIGICLLTWFIAAIQPNHQVVYISFFSIFAIIFLWVVIKPVFQKVSRCTVERRNAESRTFCRW
ncbi:hypothetical protein R1flu_016365 [Riccia fluitans]|uniref:Uncharacterized protein n=1 Tax=Riccia fluitans TaxID=41844 RepID=A0ABD1YMP2_9MARC